MNLRNGQSANKEIAAPDSIRVYVSSTSISIVLLDSRGRRHYFDPPDSDITRQWLADLRKKLESKK